MPPETEQQYKNQIAALQAEIEKLKKQQTKAIKREKYNYTGKDLSTFVWKTLAWKSL